VCGGGGGKIYVLSDLYIERPGQGWLDTNLTFSKMDPPV
jgi:hypothetical protein